MLGLAHGWKPMGTLYRQKPGSDERGKLPEDAEDYGPHDWAFPKVFLGEDAKALALALGCALPTNVKAFTPTAEMMKAVIRSSRANDHTVRNKWMDRLLVKKFIHFLTGGEFEFAYDD
jgi:hypothetical protein